MNALVFCALGVSGIAAYAQRPFPGMSSTPPPASEAKTSPVPADQPLLKTDLSHIRPTASERTEKNEATLPGISRALATQPEAQTPTKTAQSDIQQVEFHVDTFLDEDLVGITIEGNRTIQTNAILRQIETREGRPPTAHQIQQDVARLLDTRWFLSVKPFYRKTERGPVLVFQVIERPILRSVEFIGNKKIKTGELQANTGLTPGHGYDVSANRESVARIKSLYAEKGYRFAKVTLEKGASKDERDVVFVIDEGPKVKVRDINFEGNKEISSRVLKTKLATKVPVDNLAFGLVGGDYDPEIVRNDVYTLKQYYLSLGYFDVDVSVNESIAPEDGKVTVNFTVAEGPRYRVGNIEVLGNEVLSRDRLLAKPELTKGDYFNSRFLRKDVSAMKDLYDDRGHIFAKVEPTPHFRENEVGVVDLTYQIDEDIPRYIGMINIHIRGDHTHTQERVVRNQVHRFLKPGTLASGRDLRMAQQRVQGSPIWERSDPPSFDLKPVDGLDYIPAIAQRGQDPEQTAANTAADLFRDELSDDFELQQKYISPIHATVGRVTLPDSVFEEDESEELEVEIHRSIRSTDEPSMKPLDPEFVFRGQSPDVVMTPNAMPVQYPNPNAYRGQSLDRFGNPVPQDYLQGVSPQGDPFGDALSAPAPGFVDVNIDVTEGRTGRLMFGVGVNSDAGVVGQITLQEDNFDILRFPRSWSDVMNGQAFRGRGQSFRLEAVPGSQVSRYMLSWQDPFFMESDFSLGLSGFYYNRFYDDWTEDRLGGRISLGYVLNRYWSASTALRLENVDVRDIPTGSGPIPQDLLDVKGSNFLSTAAFTLSYDTRDNSFSPSSGHNIDFTYEQGFGEYNYPRFDLSGGQYFTVFERPDGFGKHILSFTGQAGWTGGDTPIFERYYAGGYSSFRGFQFRGVTPREGNFAVGGEFLALGSAEYMFPLTATDNIRAVVFSDFGTVEPDAGFDEFRVTAGFGLRMIVPAMGPAPLAFDFAWPITKQDSDETRVFSFYVGLTR